MKVMLGGEYRSNSRMFSTYFSIAITSAGVYSSAVM